MSKAHPLNFDKVNEIVLELSSIPFFPPRSEKPARLALVRMAAQVADSETQIKTAVRQMIRLYDQWPGPRAFLRALNEACKHEPCFQSLPALPRPSWFLEWSGNQNAPLTLPAVSGTLAIEASPDSLRDIAPTKALVRRRPAPVHVMPIAKPKPAPAPLSEADIRQRELIRLEVESLMNERKKGTA